jgi:hypothetical protein
LVGGIQILAVGIIQPFCKSSSIELELFVVLVPELHKSSQIMADLLLPFTHSAGLNIPRMGFEDKTLAVAHKAFSSFESKAGKWLQAT